MKFEDDLVKMMTEVVEDCFSDSLKFGIGIIKMQRDLDGSIKVDHVPFDTIENELQTILELKKLIPDKKN
jgi:hypothetical protein